MNFEHVVKQVLTGFEQQHVRYGVIGGFALAALGVPRTTSDVDFLVHRDDLENAHQTLHSLGYRRDVMTENVSHYRHPEIAWGFLDILHAFRKFSLAMLERTHPLPIFGGTQQINVLEPEDIIGLKVQAVANDPLRRAQESIDIEALMARYGASMDWERIREYYDLFDFGAEAQQLQERFRHAQ